MVEVEVVVVVVVVVLVEVVEGRRWPATKRTGKGSSASRLMLREPDNNNKTSSLL